MMQFLGVKDATRVTLERRKRPMFSQVNKLAENSIYRCNLPISKRLAAI